MQVRIKWIDIAKAITILAMIIGHTFSYGTTIRNLIFSFHMPLFFILTGYTMKEVSGMKDFMIQIKKDLFKIVLPCIIFQSVNTIFNILINHMEIKQALSLFIKQMIWASAVDVNGFPALGALWFLVVLFWSKAYFSTIKLLFNTKHVYIIFLFSGAFGILLSLYRIYLPQSWDIVFVAAMFLWIGNYIKNHKEILDMHMEFIMIGAFLFWTFCWAKGVYIEVGTRSYPNSVISILEAVCGSICVFTLAKAIECQKTIADTLSYLGKYTLIILGVHHLDGWAWPIIYSDSIILLCMKRISFDLIISVLIVWIINKCKLMLMARRR